VTSKAQTTTTVAWVKKGLPAEGRAYRFAVGLSPHQTEFEEPTAEFWLYGFTHVVDVTPAAAKP